MNIAEKNQNFINREKLYSLIEGNIPTSSEVETVLNKARELNGLSLEEVALLLRVVSHEEIQKIMDVAHYVKEAIYGKRLVLFAPVYTGNVCINNCLYCAFRRDNKSIVRKVLDMSEIEEETRILLREGHKRILLICGESPRNDIDYICEAIRRVYAIREGKHNVRRINVELAPMSVEDFRKLKKENIGTYVCFQETYEPELYKVYHPAGSPKADYENRLLVMDRAMEAGISDVGLGVLFGLADYRFEILALMEHANHLERVFGCGPHTISFPRIEHAEGAPLSDNIPHAVSDDDFKKIIAIIRIALPYTGIILSTRENDDMRTELFNYGISQISAGSRTNPGAYSDDAENSGSQFSLGDHRSLEEVISSMIDSGYIPSFCTGCYRNNRVGADFMDLAKPGLIKQYCLPNAMFSFKEYLYDFASEKTREKGLALIEKMLKDIPENNRKKKILDNLSNIEKGNRDLYF
ncbi:MAG TPA: [FeFe] hydrogenase H-cluster radical SAM maturase HydG [Bacteroidales bacterium]|nr:[FeFe] hydrogenase H-cluster radical SAM maturase HydG [Bacteroidales bacterium]HOS57290.1 [FeFe] hydrogenase H-cluster radical SAM maturase HydG [Bacteroidales bacterium]HRR03788.1 [FeFe] hydrogenase H-cluster radical SAM maturase HydG [Bacteroidales bacterium]HRT13389.1 [FeFe] hydrogenase H-cluster radical SAM maturase HydG [Bacteroidales bacterium]HXK74273.1 [FeFe] hydrogenase H-cluster radical SAM maturase HydG [Bacteroidales bacterium]